MSPGSTVQEAGRIMSALPQECSVTDSTRSQRMVTKTFDKTRPETGSIICSARKVRRSCAARPSAEIRSRRRIMRPSRRSQIETNYARFGHLLQSKTDSLAADTAHFRSAEGHDVEPVVGRIVYHHATEFEPANRGEGIPQVLRKDRGMEPITHPVRQLDSLFQ